MIWQLSKCVVVSCSETPLDKVPLLVGIIVKHYSFLKMDLEMKENMETYIKLNLVTHSVE